MKVLFALDDSKFADHALESVGSRPWPAGTEFRIITALEVPDAEFGDAESTVMDIVKQEMGKKKSFLTTLHPGAEVDVKVFKGMAKESILREAGDWPADLIVVGSHGRKGFKKLLLGSVAESILSHAPCTVEIVRIKGA